ncbi:MAG TPA: VgrG-related protein [Chloroflexota bacterium]|nr:VgrG-related protein [Chloroflexota bacterium]
MPAIAAEVSLDLRYEVIVNGSPLGDLEQITSITVEQSLYLPDVCSVSLIDGGEPALDPKAVFFHIMDDDLFPIGSELQVKLGYWAGTLGSVFAGEVAAVELEVGEDGRAITTIRAYNRAHRLHHGRQSRSFLTMSDSDIVSRVAASASLEARVDATDEVHDYVLQYNQTDWEFLRERAARNGYELFVTGRILHFRKPRDGETLGPQQDLWNNLQRIHVKLSAAEQVGEVVVRAWDVTTKKAIVGSAITGTRAPAIGEKRPGSQFAKNFGESKVYVVDRPVASQAEAQSLAQAIYNELDAALVEGEGTCAGDAGIVPGITLNLSTLGTRLSGTYYVTAVVHSAVGGVYTTTFTIGGRPAGGLYESLHGGSGGSRTPPSVVIGVVTDNADSLGRVKVQFPWLDATEVSAWARLASPMAGQERGLFCLPEVNDEVLVAFDHGDPARPFVLGALWNGVDAPPMTGAGAVGSSLVNKRLWKTRAGHLITLDDTAGAEKITIVDKTTKNAITIDSATNTISIEADGDVAVTAKGNVSISATGDAMVKAQNATVAAQQNVSVTADASLAMVSKGEVSIEGTTVSIKANATLTVDGGGVLGLKGAVVNIN